MDEKQIKLLSDSLTRSMTASMQTIVRQMNNGAQKSASPGGGSSGKSTDKNSKALDENTDSLQEHTDAAEDFTDRLKSSGKAMTGVMTIQARTIGKSLKNLQLGASESTLGLNNLLTKSSALSRALLENSSAFKDMSNHGIDDFAKKLNKTVQNMTSSNAILSNVLDTTNTNKAREFNNNLANLSMVTKLAQATMEKANVERLEDLDMSKQSTNIIKQLIPEYKKLGLVSNRLEGDLLSTNEAVRKNALAQLDHAAVVAKDTVANTAMMLGRKASFMAFRKSITEQVGHFTGFGHEIGSLTGAFATTAGAVALITTGLKGLYEQFKALGTTGLGGATLALNRMSISTLVSAKAMGEIVGANKLLMGQTGLAGFIDAMSEGADAARKHGMSTEDNMKMNVAATKSLNDFGIKVGDPKFKSALDEQRNSFFKLNETTGITIEAFNSLREELGSNKDIQESMARVNISERSTILSNIMAEQQRLTTLGLSNEQAKRLITANEALLGQTVKSRLTEAAKIQQYGALVGMGAEGAEAAQITRKGKRNRTQEENARLSEIMSQITAKGDMMAGGSLGAENLKDSLDEGLGGATKDLMMATRDLRFAIEGQRGISQAQIEENKNNANSDIGGLVTKANDALGVVLSNPLAQIVIGIAGLVGSALFARSKLNEIKVQAAELPKVTEAITTGTDAQVKHIVAEGNKVEKAILNGNTILRQINIAVGGKRAKNVPGKAGSRTVGGGSPSELADAAGTIGTDAHTTAGHPKASNAKPKGRLSKMIGAAGGMFGKLGTIAGKIALPLAILNGVFDAAGGWMSAGETFATDAPTMGQKISGALGGVLSGLTLGLLSAEDVSKGLYDTAGWIGEKLSSVFNFFADLFENYILGKIKIIGKVIGAVKGFFGFDESNSMTSLADDKEKEYAIAKKTRDTDLENSKAERQAAKKNRDAAKDATSTTKEAVAALDTLHKTTFDALSGSSLVNEVATAQASIVKPQSPVGPQTSSGSAINNTSKNDNASSSDASKVTTITPTGSITADPATILQSILTKMTELVDLNVEIKDAEKEQLRQMKSGNYAPSKSTMLAMA